MLVVAAGSRAQDAAKQPDTAPALPEAPAGGLLDDGNVFNSEEKVLVAAELEDFSHRVGLPAYVVTANYIFGNTVDQYGERLVTAWSKSRPGVVMLYERGSGQLNYSATPGALGRMEDMQALFLSASKAAAMMPDEATAAQRLRAALHGLTISAETWKKTGTLPTAIPMPNVVSPSPGRAKEEPLPAPPADFVIDQADAFNPEEEAALKSDLAQFHNRSKMGIYVAAYTTLPETTAQLWAERLAHEWLRDRPGAVLVMNRGTGPDEQGMGIAGKVTNEQQFTSAALFKAMEEARVKAREVEIQPGGSPAKGLRGAADSLMQSFDAHGDATETPANTANRWRILTGLAGALVIGSALLFLFHRFQERLEKRSTEQFLFPDVSVGRRLGATQGGGKIAGISFGKGARQ